MGTIVVGTGVVVLGAGVVGSWHTVESQQRRHDQDGKTPAGAHPPPFSRHAYGAEAGQNPGGPRHSRGVHAAQGAKHALVSQQLSHDTGNDPSAAAHSPFPRPDKHRYGATVAHSLGLATLQAKPEGSQGWQDNRPWLAAINTAVCSAM